MRCAHCGTPADEHWDMQLCAMNREKLSFDLCGPCDVALNALVLTFVNLPNRRALIRKYRVK